MLIIVQDKIYIKILIVSLTKIKHKHTNGARQVSLEWSAHVTILYQFNW